MKEIAVSFCLIFSTVGMAAQSGWTREKGESWSQLSYSSWKSSNYYNTSGQKIHTNTFHQRDINFYAEYGLNNRLTIIGFAPVYRELSFTGSTAVQGPGDPRVELKYSILRKNWPLSFDVAAELPLGNSEARSHSKEIPGVWINLPLGDGELNYWFTLALSHPFSSKAYFSLYNQYNLRGSYNNVEFSDQLRFGSEFGYKVSPKAWLMVKQQAQWSLSKSKVFTDFARQDGTTFSNFSLLALYDIGKGFGISLQANVFSDLPSARRNLYSAANAVIGITYERKK